MSIFFYIAAVVCLAAAIQERRDWMRCGGFVLFGLLLVFCGYLISRIDR